MVGMEARKRSEKKINKFAILSLIISIIFVILGYLVLYDMAPESLLTINKELVAQNIMQDEEPITSFYFFGGIVFLIVTVILLDRK